MFSFRNFLVFGLVLLFFAIVLPLLIFINKGCKKESVEDQKAEKTFMQNLTHYVSSYFIVFILMPSLLVFFCNLVKLVVYDGMPYSEFVQNLPGYSYQPVFEFYHRIIDPFYEFATKAIHDITHK